LRAELEQAWLKIAEVEECQDSLCSGYQKLENECENLRSIAETLKQEKAKPKRLPKLKLLQSTLGFKITACIIARSITTFALI
jgi:hypothetical protein